MSDSDNTFEFLIEYVTAKVVERLVADEGLALEDALLAFHNSETFDRLSDKASGLYTESPLLVYDIYRQEQRRGTLRGMTE